VSETRELSGTVYGKEPFVVRAELETFDPAQRRMRALKLAGPLLLVSLLILPVPGVHLSIPVLLVLAAVLGWRRLRQTERLVGLEGRCCADGPNTYEIPDRFELPLTLRCPKCREFVKVEAPQ
jgi:hypothetical protein